MSAPNIHLRYYLEDWTDFLLSCVKFFFVPELTYRRYEDLSQYDAMRTSMEELCQEHGNVIAKLAYLSQIIDMFDAEADECVQQLSGMG